MPQSGRQKERRLIQQAQNGDSQASERLIEDHRLKIRQKAKHFQVPGVVEEEDLYQVGASGFDEAVKRFDPQKQARLWTYAQFWVERRMIELRCKEFGTSEKGRKSLKPVMDTWQRLAHEKEQEPTDEEVAEASNLDLKTVQEVLRPPKRREISILDGREKDPDGGRPTGIILEGRSVPELEISSPEEELIRKEGKEEIHKTVMERLGVEAGPKWLVLFVLHEGEGCQWSEIVESLANPGADIAPAWANLCCKFFLPPLIPREWPDVCKLFQTPPPMLTETNLRQWYHRAQKRRNL